MSPQQFIVAAIDKLASRGFGELNQDERFVALISEAEVSCDMNGIDTFMRTYPMELSNCASAFEEIGAADIAVSLNKLVAEAPNPTEESLEVANELITQRRGYDYESIETAVGRRLLGKS